MSDRGLPGPVVLHMHHVSDADTGTGKTDCGNREKEQSEDSLV